MRKLFKTILIILLFTGAFPVHAKAEEITEINELIEKAKEYDMQEISVQGEAIGEIMDRGDYAWININDGTNAIGIWVKKSDAKRISYYGNYKYKGDMVKVTGTFQRACKEHGGEADVHGTSIVVVEAGKAVNEQVSYTKIMGAVILTVSAIFIALISLKTIRKK